MFIKISDNPERYVNTSNVEVVTFGRRKRQDGPPGAPSCFLEMRSGRQVTVSDNAGRTLLEFSESNSALLEDFEPGPTTGTSPGPAASSPLTSRLAQHLRDGAPNGAALMDLVMSFPGNDAELPTALENLQAERVVVKIAGSQDALDRYYHASNVPPELRPQSDGFTETTKNF